MLASCATLVHTNYTEVNVYSKQDSLKIYFNDSSRYAFTPATLKVERSAEPLFLTIEKNNVRKKIIIPAKLSPAFWYGNILNGCFFAGYLVDLSNPRRFKYPANVYCDLDFPFKTNYAYKPVQKPGNIISNYDQSPKVKTFTGAKGMLNLKISVPEGNSFVINKQTHIGNSFGFLGITSAISYYYSDKKYVGIGAGALTDFLIPLPAPYDIWGGYERSFGTYLDVFKGFDVQRFSFNYGLSISKYQYFRRYTFELFPTFVDSLLYSKTENRIGLSLSSVFKISSYFSCGIKYIPSFYTFGSSEWRYGHMLFLDIALNFELNKKRKR